MSDEDQEVEDQDVEHTCPTLGERLVNLRDTMLAQFREGSVEQVTGLSTAIHSFVELAKAIQQQHDACYDLVKNGDMGADKKAATIDRIRQERSDKKAKKAGKDFTGLNF